MRLPRSHAGFSLIEVLAAFVILALVATALFRLYSSSLNNASVAEEYSRALVIAQSQLDVAASAQPLRELTTRGTDNTGRVEWEASVQPYVVPDTDPDLERATEALPTRMFRVVVDVKYRGTDGKERKLSLATTRIGQRNPA